MADQSRLEPIKKWAYPVKLNGATTEFEPALYFDGLARALGGSYPLGGSGLLHPGVHFDFGTAAYLSPNGVYAIADGQIVAYRMDPGPLVIRYDGSPDVTHYSSSFVLIKHNWQLPPKPGVPAPSVAPAPPAAPARPQAPAAAAGAPAASPAQPPAGRGAASHSNPPPATHSPTLMEEAAETLSDWYDSVSDFFSGKSEAPAQPARPPASPAAAAQPAPAAPRPAAPTPAPAPVAAPPSITLYSLYMHLQNSAAYANDPALPKPPYLGARYKVKEGRIHNVMGLRIRNVPDGIPLAIVPLLSKLEIGPIYSEQRSHWKKYVGCSHALIPAGVTIASGYFSARYLTNQYVKDNNTDTEASLGGPKVAYIYDKVNGKVIANLPSGATITVKAVSDSHWFQLTSVAGMQGFPEPKDVAGNIIGFVKSDDVELQPFSVPEGVQVLSTPINVKAGDLIGHPGVFQNHNNVTKQIQLHVELFTPQDLPDFIAKSKSWMSGVAEADKTLLKVTAGTTLITPTLKDDNITLRTPVTNLPQINGAGTKIHSDLILPLSALNALKAEYKLNIPSGPRPTDPKVRWWYLDNIAGQENGTKIKGWLCEKSAQRVSPWEWSHFTKVEDTTLDEKLIAYQLKLANKLEGDELTTYSTIETEGQKFPVNEQLLKIISANKVDGAVVPNPPAITPALLRDASQGFWCAQKIASIYLKTKTEWKNDAARWGALDTIMGHHPDSEHPDWVKEKQKIEKLSFWDALRGMIGGAEQVWFLNPVNIVATLSAQQDLITMEMLQVAHPSRDVAYYEKILPILNKYAECYEVNTPIRIAYFLAQVAHESGLKVKSENGNYSAKRMREIFGCRGGQSKYNAATDDCSLGRMDNRLKLWTDEDAYANNPVALFSYVYANRNGNGNEASGEGYKYRGRGIIQLTGKTNYTHFTRIHNAKNPDDIKDFVANPDLIIDDINYGIESGFIYWDMNNGNRYCDSQSFQGLTQMINGGLVGYQNRVDCLNQLKRILGI